MARDDDKTVPFDRRHSRRFAARINVNFRSLDELVTTYTSDLSRGGIFVAASVQLPPGTEVQLSIDVPDGGPPARIPARVAYVLDDATAKKQGRAPGMGMQFHGVEVASLGERIAAHLADSVDAQPVPKEEEEPLHVLVAEDSASQRARVAATLRLAGHRVTTAEHGLEALGKALREPPDVVLSDVTMPTMDGWQLLRLLRARAVTRDIPVIFLTTLDSDEDRLRGYAAGVDDYIAKPFQEEELVARVRRVVARAREADEYDQTSSGLTGDLRQVSVGSLLAFADAERRSGLLTLRTSYGEARIGLQHGRVISVDVPYEFAPASLLERMMMLLDWEEGRFELAEVELVSGSESIGIPQALLEHARRKDEGGA